MSIKKHCLCWSWFSRNCRVVFILPILILLISSAVEARKVNLKEAERVAIQWIKRDNSHWDQRLTKGPFRHSETRELFEEGDLIGYVVDLEPSGFLILPAFTELSPVKFVSYKGNFDKMADHPFVKELRRRLAYSSKRLGYGRQQAVAGMRALAVDDKPNRNQLRVNEQAWESLTTTKTAIAYESLIPIIEPMDMDTDTVTFLLPLLTSSWDQEYPYNLYTPIVNGEHTSTGCMAVALAQVMYFWRYPAEGQGSHSYLWTDGMLSADFAHPYDWANMKDDYTGDETEIEKAAVATLMSDAGIALEVGYSLEGSGAYAWEWETALESFFKYSPDVKNVYSNDYASSSDWFLVFKNQLDLARPVLLAADFPFVSSHAVVVDGYRTPDGINQIHLNVGWGGGMDNYYSIDDIFSYGNDSSDTAVIDIYPSEYFIYAPAAPIGASLCRTGDVYQYQGAPTRDSYSDNRIEYRFDWGDGNSSPWSEELQASHAWTANGTYSVTLQARSVAQPEIVSSPSPGRTVIIDDSLYGTERGALIDFYLNTDGDNWTRNDNWKKPDGSFNDPGTEETWYGVTAANGHVYQLIMGGDGNNLNGFIPRSFGDLQFLYRVEFSCGSDVEIIPNCIGGKIPRSIGNLSSLMYMQLDGRFEGEIPEEIGNLANLRELSLRRNRLTGPIPESLGNLSNLEKLNLGKNALSGPIPSSIGNISSLKSLVLYFNQLSGAIPAQLGQLENLEELSLLDNNFSGSIPEALGDLMSLTTLDLSYNQLDGPIPLDLFNLHNLKELLLGYNNLSGTLPPELFSLNNLEALLLEHNNLSGPLPSAIGNLSRLERLKLQGNQLSGLLPSELGSLSRLIWLELGFNDFSGTIPVELSNLENLTYLDFSENRINGIIPKELGNLHKLTHFYASGNELTGSIPKELSGFAPEFERMFLQNNRLSGQFPKEIFNSLTNLNMLSLQGNMLSGEIPVEILKLTNLGIGTASCGVPTINYNALYTSDPAVIDFINARFQLGGITTQTVAPEDLAVQALTPTSVRLSWTPIPYTDDGGGYRIFYAEQPGGQWIEAGMTDGKQTDTFDIEDLRPRAGYSFFIRTQTDAHDMNKNTVLSEAGPIVTLKATDDDNDGMPDVWETDVGLDPLKNDADGDPDGDNLTNINELGAGTDPLDEDTDDDGMPDGWECDNGLNPIVNDANQDADGDGYSNLKEYQDGTDPNVSDKEDFPWELFYPAFMKKN